jgi:arsenate reductase
MHKKNILILCTGNSARSQMAEAIINHDLGDSWQAVSAGTEPAGYIHPMALEVLMEIGIQHQGNSKSVETFRDQAFDMVITVCDDAAENCPLWLGQGKKIHIGFPDPAKATGTKAEIRSAFQSVRDDIRMKIIRFLKQSQV